MRKIKLLIIEDNSMDKRLLEEFLSDLDDLEFEFTHAFRLKEAFNLINTQSFDVATLDLGLPDSHGFETFEKFHAVFPKLPTIVVSGCEDVELAVEVMKSGAHGYIVKGNFDQSSLVKEIKQAINRQDFREKTGSKVFLQEEMKQKTQIPFKNSKSIVMRDPEVLEELVVDYMQLIKSCEGIDIRDFRSKIEQYYRANQEAFTMLNLNTDDLKSIHSRSVTRLRLHSSGIDFEAFLLKIQDEVMRQFRSFC